MDNQVNHPAHYLKPGRKECIVEMEEKFGLLAVYFFCQLNAYKYEYRAGLKGDAEEDLQKAQWYRERSWRCMERLTAREIRIRNVPVSCYLNLKKQYEELKQQYDALKASQDGQDGR